MRQPSQRIIAVYFSSVNLRHDQPFAENHSCLFQSTLIMIKLLQKIIAFFIFCTKLVKIGFFAGQNRSAQFLVFDNFQIYETSLLNKIINFYFFVLYTPVILCAFHQLTTHPCQWSAEYLDLK